MWRLWRSLLLGLGAFALVAIGIHAAADCIDDHLFAIADATDEALDRLLSSMTFTQPLIDLIEPRHLTQVARSVALMFELLLDYIVGFAVFAYERRTDVDHSISSAARRMIRRPSGIKGDGPRLVARFTRPLLAACFVLAGANAVGRLVQGSIELQMRSTLGAWSTFIGRLGGLWVLGACLVVLGVDAVAATFARAEDTDSAQGLGRELTVLALGLPLAYFAVTEAVSLRAFIS